MFSFSYCSQTYAYGDKYSPDEIFELYADKSTKFNILLYFNGVGTGLFWANGDLKYNDKKPLFCPPGDLSMAAEDYFKIYRNEYFRNQELWDSIDFQPPGWIVLEGLKTKYPCN